MHWNGSGKHPSSFIPRISEALNTQLIGGEQLQNYHEAITLNVISNVMLMSVLTAV